MARKLDTSYDGPPSGAWLITFSDMVTLLLTFFVLIIAITTIDPKSLVDNGEDEINLEELNIIYGSGVLGFSNPSILAPVVELFQNQEELPDGAILNQDEIKNAIFQLDATNQQTVFRAEEEAVKDSVSIFKDERGMVIRWDGKILFPEGGSLLTERYLILLGRLAEFLASTSLPISIDCFTNPLSALEGGRGPLSFELSKERSRVVMDYLVKLGLKESRFRLGAFGGTRTLTLDPSRAAENSRMEIVIYKPPKSSWKG
jgi:chemotaxis protein MotB